MRQVGMGLCGNLLRSVRCVVTGRQTFDSLMMREIQVFVSIIFLVT